MVPTNELEGYKRSPRARRVAVWAVAALALAAVAYLVLKPAEDKEVPDFDLPLLGGGTLSSEALRGSPVVMNFFASWCAPCREEAPLLERTWRTYRDDDVRFVGVNIQDTERNARRFVREFGITYPVLRDEDQELARALDVYGLPQTYFVDDDWKLLTIAEGPRVGEGRGQVVQLGAISRRELVEQIEQLLER
jgi:peroxiredoxin